MGRILSTAKSLRPVLGSSVAPARALGRAATAELRHQAEVPGASQPTAQTYRRWPDAVRVAPWASVTAPLFAGLVLALPQHEGRAGACYGAGGALLVLLLQNALAHVAERPTANFWGRGALRALPLLGAALLVIGFLAAQAAGLAIASALAMVMIGVPLGLSILVAALVGGAKTLDRAGTPAPTSQRACGGEK